MQLRYLLKTSCSRFRSNCSEIWSWLAITDINSYCLMLESQLNTFLWVYIAVCHCTVSFSVFSLPVLGVTQISTIVKSYGLAQQRKWGRGRHYNHSLPCTNLASAYIILLIHVCSIVQLQIVKYLSKLLLMNKVEYIAQYKVTHYWVIQWPTK